MCMRLTEHLDRRIDIYLNDLLNINSELETPYGVTYRYLKIFCRMEVGYFSVRSLQPYGIGILNLEQSSRIGSYHFGEGDIEGSITFSIIY